MRIAILQPGYLPWLGFFDQMARSDLFILYDDVHFDKGGWRNRNRIKTPGGAQLLTVPVFAKGLPLLTDLGIDNSKNWRETHLKSIKLSYSRAPFFRDYIGIFESIYAVEWEKLVDLDLRIIQELRSALGIETRILRSSSLVHKSVDRVQKLIDLCLRFGADEFLEGSAGKDYLAGKGEQLFADKGIKLTYQDYQHPVYHQLYGEFVSHLSVIDLLFNAGPGSLQILTNRYQENG